MIFELAGAVGVEPWGFTLRELMHMDTGRSKAAWEQTSCILAMLYNCHRHKGAKKPKDFNPHQSKGGDYRQPITTDNWGDLKLMLPPDKRKHPRSKYN